MKVNQNKNAQVTLFVIVGAVLLLAVVLFFVISNQLADNRPEVDVPDVSLEARPAVSIVKSCLEDISIQGLELIGKQGGMLNPPEISYPSYRGESLLDGSYKIPFWRHLSDCEYVYGCEEVNLPPLCKPGNCYGQTTGQGSIQEQLENYVMDNIDSCIDDFSAISDMYDVQKNGEPSVEVIFKDEQTDFKLDYPLIISSLTTDNTVEYNLFLEEIDIPLMPMYNLARDVLTFERSTNYYERQTMNLVNIYSGLDSNLLPPTSEVNFQFFSFIPWVSFDVKEIIMYDILPFMNLITFPNADNFVYIQEIGDINPEDEYIARGIYSSFNPKLNDEAYPFEVYNEYNYDEIFFQIDDGDVLIKPRSLLDSQDSLLSKLSQLAIQDYRFNYHISYPMIITVSDPFSNQYQGYDFRFALEVNVRNNIPAYQNFTYIETQENNDVIGLADYAQRLPQDITISTFDKLTGEPLDDVVINYVCGNEYPIGVTRNDLFGEASLTEKFPYCELGGFIKYYKTGYLGESIRYDNLIDGNDQDFKLYLWPEKEKEIIVKLRSTQSIQDIANAGTAALELYETSATDLKANQSAILNVQRIITSPYDSPVPLPGFIMKEGEDTDYQGIYKRELAEINRNYQNGYFNQSTRDMLISLLEEENTNRYIYSDVEDTFTLKLVPGEYTLDASLLDKNLFTIPEMDYSKFQEKTGESGGDLSQVIASLFMSDNNFVLPEQNFSTWLLGGANITFTLDSSQVYNERPLTLYLLEQDIPNDWVELSNYQDLEDYQKGKESMLMPTIG